MHPSASLVVSTQGAICFQSRMTSDQIHASTASSSLFLPLSGNQRMKLLVTQTLCDVIIAGRLIDSSLTSLEGYLIPAQGRSRGVGTDSGSDCSHSSNWLVLYSVALAVVSKTLN